MTLKRWGKFKLEHVDCFEWNDPNTFAFDGGGNLIAQGQSIVEPRNSIAFLQADGAIYLVNFDYSEIASDGVFIIGKFQFMRRKWIQHQYGSVDTVNSNNAFSYYVLPTYDGKTLETPIIGFKNSKLSGMKSQTFQKIVAGLNISLLLKGKFNLTSLLVAFTTMGPR